jgi:hypothetical protein
MNLAEEIPSPPEQPIFWDAVWTLDDEWTPLSAVKTVSYPRTNDSDAHGALTPEFLALL